MLVVGGARATPGGALLAGLAALRVGAGRLSVGKAESVAVALAVALPQAGVTGLAETSAGALRGDGADALADSVASADALLVGPGLDDAQETARLLERLVASLGAETTVVLDAYALGALAELGIRGKFSGRLVLTPNSGEAERLLDTEIGSSSDEIADAAVEIARRYGAVVTCQGSGGRPGRHHVADLDRPRRTGDLGKRGRAGPHRADDLDWVSQVNLAACPSTCIVLSGTAAMACVPR